VIRVDVRAPLRGEAVGEQAGKRHVEEGGVGDVGVAVREGVARRLEVEVQRLRAPPLSEPVALEDVERLPYPSSRR
jgi:hypothetical protein